MELIMGLTPKQIEQLQKQPIIESMIRKSQDGEWIVHKTVITDIKPTTYLEKVLNGASKAHEEIVED